MDLKDTTGEKEAVPAKETSAKSKPRGKKSAGFRRFIETRKIPEEGRRPPRPGACTGNVRAPKIGNSKARRGSR